MTIFSDLISNVALLLALSILYSFLTRIWKHGEIPGRVLGGFLFGLVAVAGMINPFNYEPGVIFDARSMVVSMAGLFGGPLTAAISTLIAGTYRLWLGGTGALTGFGVIFTSAALGVGYYYLRQRRPEVIGSLYLFIFGIIVHLFMLLWMLTLPWPLAFEVLDKISLPVMLVFPLGTFFLGTLLADQEKRNYAQDQLVESEKRYRRIVETANEGIWVIDTQFKTTFVNRVMAEMLGYGEDEMNGRIITDFMVEGELADQNMRMTKRQKGESETYERTYRKKDGTFVWAIVSASPLINEKGDFNGSFAMLTDITERKQAEEALKENKNFIDKIINTAPNLVYIYDLVEKCNVYSNNGMNKLLGFGVNEIQGMGEQLFPTLMHSDDFDKVIAHHALLKESMDGEVFKIDYRLKNKQGAYRILRSWDTVFKRGDDGKVQQLIGLAVDVTEQIKAEESLKFEKERAKQYLDVAGVVLIAVDKDRKVTLINPKGCEILGYPQDEIIGKDWFDDFLFSGNVKEIKGVFDEIMSGNIEPVKYYENPIKTRSGDKRLIAWHNSILKNSYGNIIGLFSSGEDITEQKQAEAEQEQLRNQLTHAQKIEAIGTLAGGIAHDFNNILGIILGNTELAMDDVPEWNPARQNLDEVKKACLRAKDVVKQILSFSRKSETEEKPLNLAPVVIESLTLLRASIPTSIDIRQNISNDIDDIIGEPTQIHQTMINLCNNAAHAMENEGGIIEITLKNTEIAEDTASQYPELNPGPHVHLSVSDTGDGINPQIIDRVFDPYFTTKDVGKGTGLGLSVVHGIVKNYNGRIWIESEIGKGTTFKMLFPAVKGKAADEAKQFQELPTGEETILFVDDEESMVKLNQQRLERLGYSVIPKTDPSEALAFFLANPDQIDLIITDMAMPKMTGDKLIQAILEIRSDMPIILCTGYSNRISEESAQSLGVRKYIEKPIEKETLAKSVREVLDTG
ncbi:MAG: PAS domain S-box protein [Deltaproteobacteria bacterium]|nr:PAS domain S-box protein [Deltaproteobacteria bacterium]